MNKIYSLFLLLFLFSCNNEKKESIDTEALPETVYIHDTIIIRDTVPFISTVYVKNSNHQDAVLPADTMLTKCMEEKSNSSTTGMIDCYNNTSEKLLIKIAAKEKQLVTFLDKPYGDLLKKSQSQWREFTNAEGDFLYSTYYSWANHSSYPSLGREASIDQAEWKYTIIRDRLIALETYYERVYYKK